MTTITKKPAASSKTAAKKTATAVVELVPTARPEVFEARPILAINTPTAQELEAHLREVVQLVEEAEALAPSGIVTQTMQRAKVRAVLALETFTDYKP